MAKEQEVNQRCNKSSLMCINTMSWKDLDSSYDLLAIGARVKAIMLRTAGAGNLYAFGAQAYCSCQS